MIGYIILFIGVCILSIPIYLLIRRPGRFTGKWERRREWMLGFFVVFMAGLLFMTLRGQYGRISEWPANAVYRLRTGYEISMKPFYNIRMMYLYDNREHFLMNVLANILMFMPWGFFRPLLWKKEQRAGRILVGAILLTVCIESIQLMSRNRTVDIDDIILNFAGSISGAGIYFALAAIFPQIRKMAK